MTIDGYTQPGSSPNTLATGDNAVLKVELNGTNVPGANGLAISGTSGNSLIRGLVINRFGTGIAISGDTVGNRIEGNFIGTDPTGTTDRGNAASTPSRSTTAPSENVIGGTTPAARNVLSGNGDTGIVVVGSNVNTHPGQLRGHRQERDQEPRQRQRRRLLIGSRPERTSVARAAGARNVISGNADVGLDLHL